jgi:ankyrin repeat protein
MKQGLFGHIIGAFAFLLLQGCIGTFEPLHHAAASGDQYTVKTLLDQGADVNAQNLSGWTPLMHAAYRGHVQIAQMLLDHGADPTIKNRFGETAASIAQKQDNTLVLQLLQQHLSETKRNH